VHSKGPTLGFKSASITFHATYTHQFDQAGILFRFTNGADTKWIKSGIELFNDAARLSTVCTDNYSDWSVSVAPCSDEIRSGSRPVTIFAERSDDELGMTLWIYHVGENAEKTPLREITWPFGTAAAQGWQLEVAAAVARPSKDTKDKMEATFTDFAVSWNE
jgi:regulation of enolase protein 1 (concanavalin A-like superfamily)